MKSYFFTFGQGHAHSVGGRTFDKDSVCEVKADSMSAAREKMFESFDDKWCFAYHSKEDVGMHFYPRGIIKLNP